jgi:hypothetical protein
LGAEVQEPRVISPSNNKIRPREKGDPTTTNCHNNRDYLWCLDLVVVCPCNLLLSFSGWASDLMRRVVCSTTMYNLQVFECVLAAATANSYNMNYFKNHCTKRSYVPQPRNSSYLKHFPFSVFNLHYGKWYIYIYTHFVRTFKLGVGIMHVRFIPYAWIPHSWVLIRC